MQNTTETARKQPEKLKHSSKEAIAEMAIQYKVPIFPCKEDKTPLIKDWQKQATFEKKKIEHWLNTLPIVYWGMPTQKHFALDLDGSNYGRVKAQWLESNPYTQHTKSGGRHWLWKNPKAKIRNKARFTGDFDIRGTGGYICLYQVMFNEFATPENVPEAPPFLLALLKVKTKDTYEKGKRNTTLNKEAYQGASEGNTKKILKAVFKSGKSGLTWDETYKTAMSGIQAGGGMPLPTVAKPKPKTKKNNACLSSEIIPPEPVKTITDLGFPTGSITIFGGGQGEGKSTTILKAGAKNSRDGDKRPMLIFTRENSINNLVLPWWAQFGGVEKKLFYPTHPDFLKPEMLSWKQAGPQVIEACKTGHFALVLVDLVYLMVANELENKEYEKAFLNIQNSLHHSTAFVGTAHLKKDVKDQPLLHHFRGGTDLTGIPDRVMYLRRGQNASQRVIVKLKDRATGELDGGFLTAMTNKTADMSINTLAGSPKQILKNHAETLVSEKPEKKDDTLIDMVRRKVKSYSEKGGVWAMQDYIDWAKEIMGVGEKKARSLLKEAGFQSKSQTKAGIWKIWPK